MGLLGELFGKNKDEEPQLTIKSSSSQNRRGRGAGVENIDLQEELEERQKAYNDYRNKMLSGELGSSFGAGKGQEQLNELTRLDNLVKETQTKIDGRDERNLGIGAGLGALSGLGAITAGELAAQRDVGGSGTLGGNQQRQKPSKAEPTTPSSFVPDNTLPPQMIDEDDIRTEQIDAPIDGVPRPPTTATNLGGTPSSVGEQNLSNIGNIFGGAGGGDKGNLLDRIGQRAAQMAEEMAGISPEDIDRSSNLKSSTDETRPNNDLETTQEHHEAIEATTIQDETLDFKHLGGSRTNFDTNFIGYVLKEFSKKAINTMASKATGLDEGWTNLLIEPAVNTAPELYRLLRDGLTSDYKRLDIHDKQQSLTAPTLPLIIVILYLYVLDRSVDFKIDFNFIEGYFIKKVLKDYFNFNDELVNYGMDIISNIPNELATAYNKQKGSRENIITRNEVNAITKFIQYINIEYFKRFKKTLKDELFNFENKQSLFLYEMLETLGSSPTLFEISSGFSTINNLITEMVANPYLLVQLIALIYDQNENKNLSSSDVLSRGKVDKYIYYYSDLKGGVKEDLKVSVLKNIALDMNKRGKVDGMSVIENNDKVALYNYKGRYYLAFRGTDTKDEKDIRSGFLNFGGKDLLNNPDYDERIKIGKRYLDLAIMKSRQEGLEPPIILGFSLGGVSAMYLATLYKNIETDVYSAVLGKSEMTEKMMEYLGNSNIHFNYGEKDPISSNLEYYSKKYPNLDINKYRYNKFYSPHDLGQFI